MEYHHIAWPNRLPKGPNGLQRALSRQRVRSATIGFSGQRFASQPAMRINLSSKNRLRQADFTGT
jgi:hypothetical protein